MPSPFDQQQTPEVSTEPQRQALDEMSRQLVEKLNDMVREQNERAERFAATQHSLSALPETPQPAVPPATPPEVPQRNPRPLPPPPVREKEAARPTSSPDIPAAGAEESLPPRPKSLWEQHRPDWLPEKPANNEPAKAEENGCGSGTIITLIIVILIIIRSCS